MDSCVCVCFPPSNVESMGGEGWECLCSRACLDSLPIHKGLDGLHCYVLQHPCRWLTEGQPGALHTLPPGGAGLELPLDPSTRGNIEMGTRCESYAHTPPPPKKTLHFISNLKCALRSCLCPVCRFCVSKRFRRTTIMNICIQPCLRGVGHLRQWNSHVWVY